MTLTISQAERNPKIPMTTPQGTKKIAEPQFRSSQESEEVHSRNVVSISLALEASAVDYPQLGISRDRHTCKSLDAMWIEFLCGTA